MTKGSDLQVAALENHGSRASSPFRARRQSLNFFRLVVFIHVSSRETSHTHSFLPKRTRSNNGNAHGYVSENRALISSEIFGVPSARLVRYRNIKRIQRH